MVHSRTITILGALRAAERSSFVKEKSFLPPGGWLPAWCGLVVGICIILPVLLRLDGEGWTGPNIFLMVAGILLTMVWVAKLVSLGRTNGRKSQQKQEADDTRSNKLP